MLNYTSEIWVLLDKDQDVVCDTCKQPIPPDVYVLSDFSLRKRTYICYTYDCIARHPRNAGKDVIKIEDIRAGILQKKMFTVKKWGFEYWQRAVRPYIPHGYEDFADCVIIE